MRRTHCIVIDGRQREQIDLDLLTQIVIMLGRQLAAEAGEADAAAARGGARPETTEPPV